MLFKVPFIVLHSIGIVPHSWMKYAIPPGLTVLQWVTDFSKRIEQLQRLSSTVSKNGAKVVRVSKNLPTVQTYTMYYVSQIAFKMSHIPG